MQVYIFDIFLQKTSFSFFCVFCVFCFESNISNQDLNNVLLLLEKVLLAMQFCPHFIKIHLINTKLFMKIILCKKHAFRKVLSFSKKNHSMYRICGLPLGPNFGVRSAADKNYYLRLTV